MSNDNLPLISVVIPTCHRNDLLAKCLDHLAPGAQTLPPDYYEVIVTDDGFKTTAEPMMRERYPWAKWVAGPGKGPAANRNTGAKFAHGEWLVFTDDDCLPDTNWLTEYRKGMKGSALALEGAIHPVGRLDKDMANCPVNFSGNAFWSANIAVRRDVFEAVSGFDPKYPCAAYEDRDLQIRLLQVTTIAFISDALVFHPVIILSLKTVLLRLPRYNRAYAIHLHKHRKLLGFHNVLLLLFFQYKFEIRYFLKHLMLHNYKRVAGSCVSLLIGIPILVIHFIRLRLNESAHHDDPVEGATMKSSGTGSCTS